MSCNFGASITIPEPPTNYVTPNPNTWKRDAQEETYFQNQPPPKPPPTHPGMLTIELCIFIEIILLLAKCAVITIMSGQMGCSNCTVGLFFFKKNAIKIHPPYGYQTHVFAQNPLGNSLLFKAILLIARMYKSYAIVGKAQARFPQKPQPEMIVTCNMLWFSHSTPPTAIGPAMPPLELFQKQIHWIIPAKNMRCDSCVSGTLGCYNCTIGFCQKYKNQWNPYILTTRICLQNNPGL